MIPSAYLAGYVLGDGEVLLGKQPGTVDVRCFGNKDDKDTVARYYELATGRRPYFYDTPRLKGQEPIWGLTITRREQEVILQWGLKAWSSTEKKFPAEISDAELEVRTSFIAGLCDADGSIQYEDKYGVHRKIRINSASEDLLQGLKAVLDRLGIETGFGLEIKTGTEFECGRLSVRGNSLTRFCELIQLQPKKQLILDQVAAHQRPVRKDKGMRREDWRKIRDG